MTAATSLSSQVQARWRLQRTLAKTQEYAGIGIHTGQEVLMRLAPAAAGEGLHFKRIDLPGQPIIPATIEYVFDNSRSTNIAIRDVRIYTIEHVLAALRAFGIDNACIELSGVEPPAGNGSSDIFVEMIEQAGLVELPVQVPILQLSTPVFWSEDDVHIVALPHDSYRVSCVVDYPHCTAIGTQYHSIDVTAEQFKKEIASCRTFALYEEISELIDKGLIRGGSLDNAVVVKENAVFSKGGLFFPNEMVRHKILDVIGDLSLIGMHFWAHIIAIRSGHKANCSFAKKLFHHLLMENP